jgi:GPH family glycoside/pentoside/hexuronide:cation symporter
VRTEGLVYSAVSFGQKVGAGLGAGILGWSLAIGKFDADIAVQETPAMNSIIAVFVYIPILIQVLAIILLWVYKLDSEMPKITDELKQKHAAAIQQ